MVFNIEILSTEALIQDLSQIPAWFSFCLQDVSLNVYVQSESRTDTRNMISANFRGLIFTIFWGSMPL